MDLAGLRRSLWAGPLPDAQAPARDLDRAIDGGLDYPPALAGLRALVGHGLPTDPALPLALARWPWSIDLAALAVEARGPEAIPELAARVEAQGRRHGVLAWAWWNAGHLDRAYAALEGLDPASPSHAEDLQTLAELHLRHTAWTRAEATLAALAPLVPPARMARLRLQQRLMRHGAVALAKAAARRPPPDHPEPWNFLFHAWLAERDYPRAAEALARLAPLSPPATAALDRARLALDRERPDEARAALAALPARPDPERPAREHLLRLRLALMEADAAPDPAPLWAGVRDRARAAARLWPGNAAIRHLLLTARLACEDWDALARDLAALPPEPQGLQALARLGLPWPGRMGGRKGREAGLEADRTDAWLHLEAGDPAAAHEACDRDWLNAPTRAWFSEPEIEALLWRRRNAQALRLLDPLLARHPTRLGLILQRARARFFLGDFAAAQADLASFRALKEAAIGEPPPLDLRDRITADALASGTELPPDEAPEATGARLGRLLETHPGLAACWLARGAAPAFQPIPGAIAAQAALYWEGPLAGPPARGVAAWARMMGTVNLFTRETAHDWLQAHDPQALPAFDAQTQPAGRADVFRACRVARDGGVFVDADEYPRESPRDWLEGASAVVVLEAGYGTAANNFLAAMPGHPLMARFRAQVLARALTPDPYPWWDTGPARLTLALAGHLLAGDTAGLRVLTQADYCRRVSTNLPFPHKRTAGHWRQGLPRPAPRSTGERS